MLLEDKLITISAQTENEVAEAKAVTITGAVAAAEANMGRVCQDISCSTGMYRNSCPAALDHLLGQLQHAAAVGPRCTIQAVPPITFILYQQECPSWAWTSSKRCMLRLNMAVSLPAHLLLFMCTTEMGTTKMEQLLALSTVRAEVRLDTRE